MPTKRPQLYLSGDPEADRLLSEDPLALVIGLVLDQQIPLEWAFYGPFNLLQRLGGSFDAAKIAAMPEEELVTAFAARPALHRFPVSMAKRVQAMCQHLVSAYGGDAAQIWKTAKSGEELFGRLRTLPGFGQQKAKIFVALLGKQLGVRPEGWVEVASPFGVFGTHLSIADIDGPDALTLVRQHKRAMKAAKKAAPAKKAVKKAAPAVKKTAKAAPAKKAAAKKAMKRPAPPRSAPPAKKAPAKRPATAKKAASAGA